MRLNSHSKRTPHPNANSYANALNQVGPKCPHMYAAGAPPATCNRDVMRRYLLEPYPQQHLFASSIPLRFASHAPDEQLVRVTVGKRSQTSRIDPSSLTQLSPLPASVCRSPVKSGGHADMHSCGVCVSWGSASNDCSFCFNFTLQTPTYSVHDSYLGCVYHTAV
jgi:hypothetical protein